MDILDIDIKLLMTNEWYEYISKGLIPINEKTLKFKKYIEIWNTRGVNELLWGYDELCSYDSEFYYFLNEIKESIRTETWNLFPILNDFQYFKEKFLYEYDEQTKKYKKLKLISDKKRQEELESTRIYDISCGIFSPYEADARMLFNSLNQTKTKEEMNLIRQINYLIDQFYIYLYIKTEQAIYQLSSIYCNKQEKYLMDRFLLIRESTNIFSENDELKMRDLNTLWNSIKHQVMEKLDKNNYKKEKIIENLNFVEKIYNEIQKILNLEKFVKKFLEFDNEIDSILNPLGLTGFE